MTGPDADRLVVFPSLMREMELHSTNDHYRLFLENRHIGGNVWLGIVPNQAAMLVLRTTHIRSCFPSDRCFRSDRGTMWLCIDNRGEALSDWFEEPSGGSASGDSIVDGGGAGDAFLDRVDGGGPGDAFPDYLEGNPEI